MGRITIGLDFGTHQTKICIENKEDVTNPRYSFFPFKDLDGKDNIVLPSIIQINKDNTLSYGFVDKKNSKYGKKFYIGASPQYPHKPVLPQIKKIPVPEQPKTLNLSTIPEGVDKEEYLSQYEKNKQAYERQLKLWKRRITDNQKKMKSLNNQKETIYNNEIVQWYKWQNISQRNYRMIFRYFKQSTFSNYKWNCVLSSQYLTVWFLSYVIFKLEEVYGQDFGIPTGSENFKMKKQKAVSLLLTAYHLVEDVFANDINKFLATPVNELISLTSFIPYSDDKKQEYGLLVFPEAYAALKSLTHQRKIEQGMSLMVDIGGGTTDMSFFTVENDEPKIYDYASIPYALNFILESAQTDKQDKFDSSMNLYDIDPEILASGINQFSTKLKMASNNLVQKLCDSFRRTDYPMDKLIDALKKRPVIYSGGGSTYKELRMRLGYFSDIRFINPRIWDGMTIEDVSKYAALCPIISTAVGLSISEVNDDVQMSTTEEIFKHLEGTYSPEDRVRPKWV